MTERDSIHRTGRDSLWQKSGTSHILISATQWPHRPQIAPSWFYRVGNKPSVKADLVICSYVLGMFKSVGLIISNKLNFISCGDLDGFCKSSHISLYNCMSSRLSRIQNVPVVCSSILSRLFHFTITWNLFNIQIYNFTHIEWIRYLQMLYLYQQQL